MNAVDRLVAGARRAWGARRRVLSYQAQRGVFVLVMAELATLAIEGRRPGDAALATFVKASIGYAFTWAMLETFGGTRADVWTTRALGGPGSRSQRGSFAVGWPRAVLPWLVALAPAVIAAGALQLGGAPPPPPALVMPVLITTVATLIACAVAIVLHVRVGAAYALGGVREARAWARAHRGVAFATWAVVASMRFGAAWLACLMVSVVSRSSLALVAAIVVAGVLTRGIALGTWLVTVEETVRSPTI